MIEARGTPPVGRTARSALVRAYSFYSHLYGRTAARLERPAVLRGLELAQVKPDERVLEVGVGTAAAFARLERRLGRRGQLVGVDFAPGMLAATRRRVPAARLARADARSLPFVSDHFDLLWASYILEIFPTAELTPLLVEFRRVLRPGGRLLLVNFSRTRSGLMWWERIYLLTPTWLIPWVFAGCRPVEAEPFVHEAGFVQVGRIFVAKDFPSEIITARK